MSAFDSASYIWHHSTLQPAADAWAPVSGASAEYTFPVNTQYAKWMPPAPTNQQAFVNTDFASTYKLVLPGHIIDPGRFDVRFLVNFDALNAYISGTTSVETIDAQNWRIVFGPASNWIRYYRQSSNTQEPFYQFDLPSSASFSDYSGWKWVRLSPTSSNGHLSTLAALYIADETSSWGAEVDFASTWNISHYDWGLDQAETFEEGSTLDKLSYLPIAEIDIRDITESQVFHWRAIDHENVWTSSAAYYPSSEKVSGSQAGVTRATHPVILDEHAGTFLGEANFQLQLTGSPVINTGSEYAVAVALKFPSITPADGLTDSREFYWQGSAGALAQTPIILELVGSDVSNPGVLFNMATSSSVAPLSASNVGYNEWFVVTRQRRNDVEQGWINDTLVYAASSSENEKSQSYGTSLNFLTLGYDGTSTNTSYGMHAGLAIWTSSSLSDEEIGDLKTLFFPTMADGPPPDLPPIATLYSPISGAVYYPTESVQLSGSATDAVDGDLTGSALQWTSSLDGAIGTGSLINHVPLTAGVHTITFNAVDSSGSVDTITSDILVNSYPTSSLTSPLNLSNYEFGQTVTFSGSITDPEDGTLVESALQWTSSADGALETGSEFTLNTLSAGSHSITLRGADSFGFETSTSVDINIEQNQYPVATIASPNALDNYIFTQNVTFSGSITDPEGGDLAESALQWTSSLDGALETGSLFSLDTLSIGSHSITLRGADAYGLEGSASVNINVAQNRYPTASIVTPIDAGNYIYDQLLTFSGSVIDPEDGALAESALQWTSSLDGALETGSEFSLNTLSVGSHSITLRGADSFGVEGSSSVNINVTVNQYPTASIVTPSNLDNYIFTQNVIFSGSVVDPEDGTLSESALQWTSSLDGGLETGSEFALNTLSIGSHSITLHGADVYGLEGSASVNINVAQNLYPTVLIDSPNPLDNYIFTQNIIFSGSATDAESGILPESASQWTSSLDGALETGSLFSLNTLSVGSHSITFRSVDSFGLESSASVDINVTVNQYPTTSIATPVNEGNYIYGQPLVFSGSAIDPEENVLPESASQWTSSLDGALETGSEFSLNTLSVGSHSITFRSVDSFGLAGSSSVSINVTSNLYPVAFIASPSTLDNYIFTQNVTFSGSIIDPDGGILPESASQWTSSLDGALETGSEFSLNTLSVGSHSITLRGADVYGLEGSASVDINVAQNQYPTSSIVTPIAAGNYIYGQLLVFSGSSVDPEEGILPESASQWTSSLDGGLETGSEFSLNTLSVGSHSITLRSADSFGLESSSSVSINVTVNQYPTASITSPLNLSSTVIGDPITFSGSATDPEGDSIAGSNLQWTSSLDGGFGTGLSFIDATLSGGSHSITLVAYDSYGLAGSASIDINVDAGGYPTGTIIFPNDGGNYTYGTGTPLQFTGSATDSEDGTLTGSSLVWISDVDGALGTGELLSVPSVTEGFHIITLIAQDSTGKQASSSVTINATSRDVEAAPPEEKEKTVWTKEVTTDPPEKTHQLGYERQDQVVEVTDRGNQTRFADDDSQPISVTLEYIDGAVMAHLVNQVKLEVDAEDKRIAVPVEYASSERWKQFRKDGFLRDGAGVLQIPLLLFRKTRILKGKGMQSPINKYLDRTYQTGWNRHQTYDKFSVLNSIIPSKELISVRVPDYVVVNYEFVVWTDYVEQMNGILERLNFEMDNYWGQRNNFKFNVTVNDYQTETDISPEDNRVIKTEFSAEVKAYLLPETYYHTDKGVKTTSEKRYSYKKVMNIYEIDSGDRITED